MTLNRLSPAALVALLLLSACGQQDGDAAKNDEDEEETPPVPVETSKPERGDIYWGSGKRAGAIAGRTDHSARFFKLVPNPR